MIPLEVFLATIVPLSGLVAAFARLYLMEKGKVTKYEIELKGKEEEVSRLKKDVDEKEVQIKNLNSKLKEQEDKYKSLEIQYKELQEKIFVRYPCPICQNFVLFPIPKSYQLMGVHAADGLATRSLIRKTEEVAIRCPQCGNALHLDLRLSL